MSPAEDAITKLSFRLTLWGTLPGQSGVDFQPNLAAAIVIQVAKARLNKQIAGEMSITETTVKCTAAT